MKPSNNPNITISMKAYTDVASIIATVVGALVLFGWWRDIAVFKSIVPGLATMKPNTAAAFLFSGLVLWLKQPIAPRPLTPRVIANTCAFLVLLIGALTLIEYLTGIDLGIDQLLFADPSTAISAHPGRMASATAFNFCLLGAALLLLDYERVRGRYPSQGFALIAGIISLAVLIGYLYDVQDLYRIEAFSSVALHTAALFFLLSLAILCARPDRSLMLRVRHLRYGLAAQVITLVVAALVLVSGLISAVMMRQSQNAVREQIIANNLASVDLATEFAHRYIESTQISIRLFARTPFIEQSVFSGNFSRATPELREFLQLNPRVNGCSIIDSGGIYRATGTTSATSVGTFAGDREWFQQVKSSGKAYLGLPTMTRNTARAVVPYAVPIRNPNGDAKGMLLCGISLAALNDTFAKFQTGPSARASVADRRGGGIILAHTDRSRILKSATGRNKAVDRLLQGERGAMETTDSAGELSLAVYAPVPDLPWGIMILQPTKAAFAPINRAARENMLYIAILLVFTAIVTGVLARRVTRPLAHLRAAASRVGGGELTTRLNFTRQDELGDLGRTFDQMAATLAERSAQLRAAHDELQSQYLQIQDANRLKSEFLANMSHELRTPLNAIIGFAQLIHDGKVGAISADQHEYLGDILTSADHLLQLINDILDLAKVESGKLEFNPEPVDLAKLITEVRTILQPLAASKRLDIGAEVDNAVAQVTVDPAKLKQVLYNYLSNAIKFTLEAGHITVRARPELDNYFRLEVEDTGIGISPDEIEKLFVAFQQLDASTTKKHQGTGLGLVLTKKIVEAQGGRVGVQRARRQGSIFYAVLPKSMIEKETAEAGNFGATPAADAPMVLVIDDSEPDLKWLTHTLTEAGYSVDSAKTGAEGTAKVQKCVYSAILLDLILPDVGGWETLRAIRSTSLNQSTPVVVVTVVAEKGVAKGFPVQDYLVKPIRPEALLDSLKNAGVFPRNVPRRVMVVDDDEKTLKLARVSLHACGYEVTCYTDGASALRAAERSSIAAVVLDLLMPQMDGFEFLDHFRKIAGCQNIPVIVWTNKDITHADMERLKHPAQTIALKNRDSIDDVLKEVQRHSPAIGNAPILEESAATAQ
ncbi:MAG TPA: response regulator [Candidatus Binatia bacterium]